MRAIVHTLVILVLLTPTVAADDPASRFPANALLYAELTDLRDLPQKLVDVMEAVWYGFVMTMMSPFGSFWLNLV